MRESLTVLAIVLIAVLTTALVGPYFVDWNAHRGEIQTRLSALLGADVTVAGPIDVKLLPRPIFRLQQVTVAGRAPREATVSADRVDVELALTAMLRGDIRIVDADLTAPKVTLSVAPDRSIVLPHLSGADPGRVSLGHIGLHDGTLVLVGETGQPVFTATGLDGDGEAESLVGPFKFAGHVDTPRGSLGFRLATGAFDADRLRLKAVLDAVAGAPKTDIEGMLVSTPGPAAAALLSFEGQVTAASTIPLAGTTTVVPWRVVAHVHAKPGQAELSDIELRAGADGRALVATGIGHIDLQPTPVAGFVLKAKQADIAKFVMPAGPQGDQPGSPDAAPAGPPPALADDLAALKAVALDADAFTSLPLPVKVDYAVDTVTLGQQTLAGLTGQLTFAPDRPLTGSLAIGAPDGSHLKLDGTFEPGPAAVFKGRIEAASRDLGHLADGFAPDLPDVADALRHALPVKSFGFAGAVDLSGIGFAAHDVDLSLDRSSFRGTITLTREVGQDRARLFADLASDGLDLDALPDWRDTAQAATGLDLSLALSAKTLRLAQSDTGSVTAGRIDLRLNKAGSAVTLDRLALADVGGATADITGRSDGHAAHAEGHLDARSLRGLLNLVDRLAPNRVSDVLLTRADALSPGLFSLVADAAAEADGAWTPRALALDGTAAGTRIMLRLTSRGEPAPGETAGQGGGQPAFEASLKLDAPESGALLRQIGLATLPATAIGHGKIDASVRFGSSGAIEGGLAATLGDSLVAVDNIHGQAASLVGHVSLTSGNVAPLLRAVTVATPGIGAVWPMDAAADLAEEDQGWGIRALSGHLIGSAFKGDLVYRSPPPSTAAAREFPAPMVIPITGALTIARLPLPVLAGLALGPIAAPKPGALWPDTPFAPSLLALPRTDVALTVAALPLTEGVTARDATLGLRLGPGVVALSDLSATLGEGRIGASLTLRRDGGAGSLNGHVDWSGLPVASPSFSGRSQGDLDLAGTGSSVAALVASLAGAGTIGLDNARLPRLDATAIARAIKASDAATALDDVDLGQTVDQGLDRGALTLGPVTAPVTMAAGVIRGDPIVITQPTVASETVAALDVKTMLLSLKTTAKLLDLPKDWIGGAPQVSVAWSGPFLNPSRAVDATALVNGVAARAIARDQARIEAFQDDIRERAFFARRLKAIEAEQQAARDKARREQEVQLQKLLQSAPTSPGAKPPLDLSPKAQKPAP